jgi:predicted RND superfamily exporter protein
MAPTIILTLAVADSIHILVTMFQQIQQGRPQNEAVAESLRINLQPVFLTSLTTAIGFVTMNFSDAPPFRDLGNIVAIGVMAAFFYSVLFLPALMAILPLRMKSGRTETGSRFNERLGEFVIRRRKSLLRGILAVIVISALGNLSVELNDNFIHYFDERYDFRRATNFIEDNLTGFDIIEYSLDSGEPGGINNPEYLVTLEKFKQWYLQQPKVVRVDSFVDIMKKLNQNMHANAKAYYRIPASRELAAQYLLLYQMSLPFGLDLNNRINVDKSATRMVVTLKNVTSRNLREMDASARKWLKGNAPESMFTYGTGLSIMFAHISKRNIESMLGGSFLALALISGILVLALRSLKLGAISLVPNLTPAFMAFGVWGMTVGMVGMALSVMVAMTIGIVVDDSVHFLSKYIRARRELGMSSQDAVRYSFRTVGTALIVTTVALMAGFIVLSFSGFKVNAEMGMLTTVTIAFALALDFLFLPPLLMRIEGHRDYGSGGLFT